MSSHSASMAQTPPMGWNSWNQFGAYVNEDVVRETAEAMAASGLREAGYVYVVIDDHWHGGRDEKGVLFPDPAKFPSGMKALADTVHSLGMKFGIYSDAGVKTCGGRPGSQDFEAVDGRTFAAWGVDYLKYDFCYAEDTRANAELRYAAMGRALRESGRDIVFSICEWGHHRPWLWGEKVGGHLWRTTSDICDSWYDTPARHGGKFWGIETIGFEKQRRLEGYAGPGHWNDPDMLVVGLNGTSKEIAGPGCTDSEYRTHFSLWCMLAAPLMIGCDVRELSPATREILLNTEVIALNQDPLGQQGFSVSRWGEGEVWKKPLHDGLAVGLFNRDTKTIRINAHWSDLEIEGPQAVRDLWRHEDLGVYSENLSFDVQPHGCVVLKLVQATVA